jgi:hypothetical protein
MTQERFDSTSQPSPTPPPRPTFQAAPIGLPETAAPTPPNSVVVAPPLGPALTAMVDDSRADLAKRLTTPVDQVELVEVRTVVWPNNGLGCPRPGMEYLQVPVDGLLIRLRAAGQIYDYHTDGIRPPFLCEQKLKGDNLAPAPGPGEP